MISKNILKPLAEVTTLYVDVRVLCNFTNLNLFIGIKMKEIWKSYILVMLDLDPIAYMYLTRSDALVINCSLCTC